MSLTTTLEITKHAGRRMGQRGIRLEFLNALLEHADTEAEIGHAVAIRVSRAKSRRLNINDRLHQFAAVVSADGALVTILPVERGIRGRRYRRTQA